MYANKFAIISLLLWTMVLNVGFDCKSRYYRYIKRFLTIIQITLTLLRVNPNIPVIPHKNIGMVKRYFIEYIFSLPK